MRGGADREGVMEGEEGRALPKQFFPSKQFFEEILPKGLTVATGRHGMLEEGGGRQWRNDELGSPRASDEPGGRINGLSHVA